MRRRLIAVLMASMLATSVAACAKHGSDAGDGFALSASQLLPTTTTTAPKPSFVTVVAAAKGPDLEVFENKPTPAPPGAPGATAAPGGAVAAPAAVSGKASARADLPPIPRKGLNSAGSARTDQGWTFSNPTYFKNALVVVVMENDGDWLKVLIPARPNGTEGWVRASDVTLSEHRFHMQLTLSDYTLRAWDGDQLIADTQVVIGKDATATPTGHFYMSEKIKQASSGGAYGPWILSTNGYSEKLDTFDGGLPVLGFHGTNQPQLIGSKASNGCVRIPNEVVTQLADVLPEGTPIDILP